MTKPKDPKDFLPVGNPTKYRPEHCQALVDHCESGGSFEAFAKKINVSVGSLYNWLAEHPEFLEARSVAQGRLHAFYEQVGMAIATGQLKRVKSERVARDKDGNVVYDKDHNPVIEREYESVPGNATAWIFMARNMLGWRNDVDLNLRLPGQPKRDAGDGLTAKERFQQIREAMQVVNDLQQEIEAEESAIDVSPRTA